MCEECSVFSLVLEFSSFDSQNSFGVQYAVCVTVIGEHCTCHSRGCLSTLMLIKLNAMSFHGLLMIPQLCRNLYIEMPWT